MAVLPDGRVVSRSDDKRLRVWDASSGVCERVVRSADAAFAALDLFCRQRHSLLAKAVALDSDGPVLATSTARIHASEYVISPIAAGSIAAPVLVCGSGTGKMYFMTVVAAR